MTHASLVAVHHENGTTVIGDHILYDDTYVDWAPLHDVVPESEYGDWMWMHAVDGVHPHPVAVLTFGNDVVQWGPVDVRVVIQDVVANHSCPVLMVDGNKTGMRHGRVPRRRARCCGQSRPPVAG